MTAPGMGKHFGPANSPGMPRLIPIMDLIEPACAGSHGQIQASARRHQHSDPFLERR